MFDKNEELTSIIEPEYLLENQQSQILNGLISATISAPYSKDLEEATYIGSKDIDDNSVFWLYKVDKRKKEKDELIINATYSLFDDLKAYGIIRDKRPNNASALTGINAILESSRWQVGNVTSNHVGTANWYYVSRLEAFWEYLENWNVEFKPRMTFSKGKITGRYIDIVDKLSDDYGKWYEYGDKLVEITAEQASDSLYTAFVGRGKGEEVGGGYGRRIGFEKIVWETSNGKPVNKPLNQDYVEIPYATEQYGYSDGKPRMTVIVFEQEEDPAKVLEKTYDYALSECRPKLQMKAEVIENGLSELGEICTIIRDDRGIRYKTRVFKLNRDFLKKGRKNVEFGDEIIKTTAKRNNAIVKEIKKKEEQTINWLESLHLELQDTYFNEDGYNYEMKADNEYDLPGGYYSFNAPIDQNPTKVIYLGAGMLAIANSKNPDGSWRFRTWGTGDGFTADLINAGTLNANLVNVTNIKAENITGKNLQLVKDSWNGISDYADMNADRLKFIHLDGSSTEIGKNGLRRITTTDNRNYHYLFYATTFIFGESSSNARWIQLPDDYKGKQFKVFLAIADSMNAPNFNYSIQRFVCTVHPDHSIDYNNARVPVISYKSNTLMNGEQPVIDNVQGLLFAIY